MELTLKDLENLRGDIVAQYDPLFNYSELEFVPESDGSYVRWSDIEDLFKRLGVK